MDEVNKSHGSSVTRASDLRASLNNGAYFTFWDQTHIHVSGSLKRNTKPVTLTSDQLVELYQEIGRKLVSGLYSMIPSASFHLGEKMIPATENFKQLGIPEQCLVMNGVLTVLAPRRGDVADLSLLGIGKSGTKILSNLLMSGIQLVHQSVTGFFEKVIWEAPAEQ